MAGRKGIAGVLLSLLAAASLSGSVQAKEIDPGEFVIKQKEPVYYVKLVKNARIHDRPSLVRKTTVSVMRRGEILPVWEVVGSPYGVFFRVGKNLYVHYSVAKVVPWL